MNRHAYLIMIHKNLDQLYLLLSLLNDDRNDIYLHFDKKMDKILSKEDLKLYHKSNIYILDERLAVSWGGYSQVLCELALMKEALKNDEYSYFHLLSGMDLPLKNQNVIHEFFRNNNGYEFLWSETPVNPIWKNRVRYYYFFQDAMGNIKNKNNKIIVNFINKAIVKFQHIFHIERNRNQDIHFGSSWFSLTENAIKYIIDNEEKINMIFKYALCPDELFIQTILAESSLYKNLYMFSKDMTREEANLRLIDWQRGRPYVWKTDNYYELIESNCLFARKFDINQDKEIIYKIISFIQ